MREAADTDRIRRLARELGRVVTAGTRMYLTGGATAVLEGWRDSTVDVDVRFEPDSDAALTCIRDLEEELFARATSRYSTSTLTSRPKASASAL